ncbi:protein of unknown function [Taphrina deformans PYCC 5710]|uniref:Large ribosomal subunit protein mL59 domain-containing protein n=1 Tax=Taphrina deformans (strain PYCC 5710 / ATCC 11124 / CBS 356.35 / IMI 108563 / JCM 9778 / NBRC 8474) TaxID=1097556 RepID=R4XG93_TAPDE|nr:protein of unknown function [Taphrina deformans PYCC 5710]|eukprot:CCG84922.1 protein of unknown function [Taphrina deformans PYCC 5710]
MPVPTATRQVVSTLPRQLLTFFKKHPPASATSWLPTPPPQVPDVNPASDTASTPPRFPKRIQNPFLPSKNKITSKYNEPRYSVRRQTDLYNLATQFQIQHLLPPRVDHKEGKVGKVMKGLTQWKGTKMERTRDARVAAIKTKTALAKKVVRTRKSRTKAKKRAQRTGLILN